MIIAHLKFKNIINWFWFPTPSAIRLSRQMRKQFKQKGNKRNPTRLRDCCQPCRNYNFWITGTSHMFEWWRSRSANQRSIGVCIYVYAPLLSITEKSASDPNKTKKKLHWITVSTSVIKHLLISLLTLTYSELAIGKIWTHNKPAECGVSTVYISARIWMRKLCNIIIN